MEASPGSLKLHFPATSGVCVPELPMAVGWYWNEVDPHHCRNGGRRRRRRRRLRRSSSSHPPSPLASKCAKMKWAGNRSIAAAAAAEAQGNRGRVSWNNTVLKAHSCTSNECFLDLMQLHITVLLWEKLNSLRAKVSSWKLVGCIKFTPTASSPPSPHVSHANWEGRKGDTLAAVGIYMCIL